MSILEILPHPSNPEARIFPLGIRSERAADAGERPIVSVIGTDGSEDRHGSVINPAGWDVTSYRENPVVLWGHEQARWPAIGRTVSLKRVGGQWVFDIEFAVEQWRHMGDNIAATVHELMRDGFLNAVSVSFIPKEWKEREASTIPSFFAENIEYTRQELTEISVVNVGSNRNALKKALAAGKLTENQVRGLGLDAMMRVDLPYQVRAVAPPADQSVALVGEFRTSIVDILTRCCGYYSEPVQEVPVSPEVAALEQGIIDDLAGGLLDELENALRGWKICEHDELRSLCSSLVSADMYLFDRLAELKKRWYGTEIGATIPELNTEDLERAVEAAEPLESAGTAIRIGAVLSAKNKAKVKQIIDLASDLLAAAEPLSDPQEEDRGIPNTIRIISGGASHEHDANGQPFRVLVPDASDRGNRGESTPPATDVITLICNS